MSGAEIFTDLGQAIAVKAGTEMAASYFKKHKSFNSLKKAFKFTDDFTADVGIYMSMFLDFNQNYSLEEINEKVCETLSKHKSEEDSNIVTYKEQKFEIVYEYNYSKNAYAGDVLLEVENPFEQNDKLFVPSVSGISFYLYPEIEEGNRHIETQLLSGYCFLDDIETSFLVFFVIQKGKFLYILTSTIQVKTRVKKHIEDKYKKFKEKGEEIHYVDFSENALKIKLDKLVSARLGEILQN